MQNPSSLDRIVSYFRALANEPFIYQNKLITPYSRLVMSRLIFRNFSCPPSCGACCMKCSLVWPIGFRGEPPPKSHPMWKNVQEVEFTVNGTTVKGFEDSQADHSERFCRHLDESGRCGIYEYRPLPCKFELFKFIHFPSKDKAIARVQLPGRGWALTRVDGKKGAKCEILPYSKDATRGHVEDLRLIRGWMHVFKIQHDVTELIQYMETGPHDYDLEIIRPHARRMRGLTE